jgi:hypothetical protein
VADKLFGISLRDQRMKWLVVVGLAAVLLAVIAWGGDAPSARATATTTAGAGQAAAAHRSAPAAGNAAVNTAGTTSVKTAVAKSRSRRHVATDTEDELEMTLKFDPFALSSGLQVAIPGNEPSICDQKAQEELAEKARVLAVQQRLSEFRGKKVSVLLRTSDGVAAARIGGRVVREGEIVDGIRILSISTDGVVVEAVSPPQ